jgi:hypothetical protein
MPRLLERGPSDVNVDVDATFISNRVKRGHDDRGVHPTPIPDSPLNMDMSPSHHDRFSPPWVDDVLSNVNAADRDGDEASGVADAEDGGTPLYFPPSPPNRSTQSNTVSSPSIPVNSLARTPPEPPLSSPSGSDYSEKARQDEQTRQGRMRLRGHQAVTPTQEEQDDEDDQMLGQEVQVSSPSRLTAMQKGKGKASTRDWHRSDVHSGDEAGDEAGSESEQNSAARPSFKSGPVRAAAKAQVIEARRIYHETVAAVAREEDKPVQLLFEIVGEKGGKSRRINIWNAFQSWYSEHGEIRREDGSMYFHLHCLYLLF